MERYVWKAIEKVNGLQLIFLTRDIMVRFPSISKVTLRRNSKLHEKKNKGPNMNINFFFFFSLKEHFQEPEDFVPVRPNL